MRIRRRAWGSVLLGGALVVPLVLGGTTAVGAPVAALAIDFAGYTTGDGAPAGQNGWSSPTRDFDFALVENADYPASGLVAGRSLQLSNARTPSSNRYLTTPLIASAGESSTGAAYNTFEASFVVASATGALQDGLAVEVATDGASRYGGVLNLRHTAAGLEIGSYWMPWGATDASNAGWRSAVFATVPAETPHRIRLVVIFLDDQPDVFQVFVDDALVSAGSGATSWEVYYDVTNGATDAVVDQLSFKTTTSAPAAGGVGYATGIPALPAAEDAGFLFSDIGYSVTTSAPPVEAAQPELPAAPDAAPDTTVALSAATVKDGDAVTFSADGFLPFENVYLTYFSTPQFGGWFQADAAGRVSGSVTLPKLEAGTHTLQFTGPFSGNVAAVQLVVLALAETGRDSAALGGVALLILATGGALLVAARRGRVRTR